MFYSKFKFYKIEFIISKSLNNNFFILVGFELLQDGRVWRINLNYFIANEYYLQRGIKFEDG